MGNFKKVIVSDFLGTFSVSAVMTYAYWFVYNQTHNQLAISILGVVSMIALIFAFVGGYITDQHSKIRLLRVIAVIRLTIMTLGCLSILIGFNQVRIVFLVVILDSLLSVIYAPLAEAIAPALVSNRDELFQANSWVAATNQIASIASSLLATGFVYLKQPLFALALASISGLISLTFLLNITADPEPPKVEKLQIKKHIEQFSHGLKLAIANPIIKFMIPIAIVTNFCYWSIWLLMPKFSIDVFSQYHYAYNLIDISLTVGGIVGAMFFSRWYHAKSSTHLLPYFLAGQALMLVVLGVNGGRNPSIVNVVFVGIAWIGYGFCNSIFSIIYFSTIQLSTDTDKMGTIIGAVLTIFSISNPIASLVSTPLSRATSLQTIILSLAVMMLVAVMPMLSPSFRKELNSFEK